MDDALLRDRLRQSEQRNEALSRELASLRASQEGLVQELGAVRCDYDALVDATRVLTDERDRLLKRVAVLEAANNRLVDMLWGRRSKRRRESPDQQHLDFGDGPDEPPSEEEQEIIEAQAKADAASDLELLRRLETRRKARREKKRRQEEFPPDIERRERTLDGERPDQLRGGHDLATAPADVAAVVEPAHLAGRRHDAPRAVAQLAGRGGSGGAGQATRFSSGDRSGPAPGHRPTGFGHQLCLVVHGPQRSGALQRVPLVADACTAWSAARTAITW